jgi:dTMP kinase
MTGLFITFEGGEGSGKTTQIRLLKEAMEQMGKEILLTREPGGSEGAEKIRPLLVSGNANWDALTEVLLFSAARRDHLVNKIWPALKEGKIVLCDRFADSTLAYQGYGRKDDKELQQKLIDLYQMIAGDFRPDLTFILDIDPEIGLKRSCDRLGNNERRFEDMDIQFHKNLRQAFLKIAQQDNQRCHVIQTNRSVEEIHQDITEIIKKYV